MLWFPSLLNEIVTDALASFFFLTFLFNKQIFKYYKHMEKKQMGNEPPPTFS